MNVFWHRKHLLCYAIGVNVKPREERFDTWEAMLTSYIPWKYSVGLTTRE